MNILVFAPHSAIWVHAFPEGLIAEALRQAGHKIIYITCGKLFQTHCVAMSASSVGYDAPADEKRKSLMSAIARRSGQRILSGPMYSHPAESQLYAASLSSER